MPLWLVKARVLFKVLAFSGNGETRVTTTLNERIISPVEIGCEEYTSIASAGFDGPPILVANKNSRSGNNGGWIRRL